MERFSIGEWSKTTPTTSPFLKIGAAVVRAFLSKNSLKSSVVLTVPLNAVLTAFSAFGGKILYVLGTFLSGVSFS